MHNLHADKSLHLSHEDKLNRYPFAKRIAEVIKQQTAKDCIVLGLYGTWGEGKSTVLNFIHHELVSTTQGIVVVNFNPWRFSDEETLLKGFYETLAIAVTNSRPKMVAKVEKKIKKAALESNIEYISGKAKYIVAFAKALGYPADWSSITELIENASIEDLKERLNTLLEDYNQRLVVIIDDIDRLDENEVHAIFKLVKLNADFEKTTYILSFDEKVISRVVGKKFVGDSSAGETFLEKIIQVPIHLPPAYQQELTSLAFEKLDELFKSYRSTINITPEEEKEFGTLYVEYFQPVVKNPRLIVRYINTINFSLPLLFREVNTIDLMCIEGIKVFHPQYYEFIHQNQEYFLHPYVQLGLQPTTNPKLDEIKSHLNRLSNNLPPDEKKAMEFLLFKLFPLLRSAFKNHHIGDDQYRIWLEDKRICSREYFGKYFTFSVAKGRVSNVAFDSFVSQLDEYIAKDIAFHKFKSLLSGIDIFRAAGYFITKIKTLEWKLAKMIAESFGKISDKMSQPFGPGTFFTSDLDQSVLLVSQVLKIAPNIEEQTQLASIIIRTTPNTNFAIESCRSSCLPLRVDEEPIINGIERQIVFNELKDRLLSECGDSPIFIVMPNISTDFLLVWREILGEDDVKTYVNEYLLRDDDMALIFIRNLIPWHQYEGDFRNEEYHKARLISSTATIRRAFIRKYGEDALKGVPTVFHYSEGQTIENILLQFEHAYNQDPRHPNQD